MLSLFIGVLRNARGAGAGVYWFFVALIFAITFYYLFLLSNGTLRIFAPEAMDKVFDSMLVHLLRGEFNIDREAIGFEAATRNGLTYTYFGVFPALLRLLAMPFVDVAQAELARLSCLTAVVIFVALQVRMLLVVYERVPAGGRGFLATMVAATVLSGPQVYLLGSAWIYHEPILWAGVLAAAFNLIAVRRAFGEGALRFGDLVLLAVLAGLAINTRAPVGVALYLGTVLLIVWTAWTRHATEHLRRTSARVLLDAIWALARDPCIWLPILVLGLLAAGAGMVNFERWGNPFVFAGADSYWVQRHPDFMTAVHEYGTFNLRRVWVGALYYATGIPYVLKAVPPFAQLFKYTQIEAPPLSPLLTNPLTVLLAGVGLYRLWGRPDLHDGGLAILRLALVGHACAVALILAYFALTMRYRFDFAPFTTLVALVGYRSLSMTTAATSDAWSKRLGTAGIGLCVLGILGSHYILLVHKVWSIGVPMDVRLALFPFAPLAYAAFEP